MITSISLDHVKTLGDTVELIAREKAGIIKRGTPVVVSPQKAGPMAVIREAAARVGAPLVEVDEEVALAGAGPKGAAKPWSCPAPWLAIVYGHPCWAHTKRRTRAPPSRRSRPSYG